MSRIVPVSMKDVLHTQNVNTTNQAVICVVNGTQCLRMHLSDERHIIE